ncbi:MAG TPA: alpha/beta hydrolase [Albitalea sp.]|uniref:alpha/beta fold hydrolase n=1 Tax=Piscinibacter sp. TaxID=1903157 RepID=UPI002ED54BAC
MVETFIAELPHGIRLSCRAAGPQGAPVLVFLHGFPEAAFIWDELLAHFAPRYRCIAPNLRGYEDSSAPEDVADYRPKLLVADIAALIDQCGAPVEALVAHDWGGAVAWNVAVQHPQRLQRLVIVNSPHPGTFLRELQHNPAQQAASAYMNFLRRPDAERLLAENDFARLWGFMRGPGGASSAHWPAWLGEPVRAQYLAVWRRGLRGPVHYYRASPLHPPTAEDPSLMQLQLPPQAVTVRVPTHVVWGEADSALLPGLLDGLEEFVPQLTMARIPGATHWVIHEQPARVAQEIEVALAAPQTTT